MPLDAAVAPDVAVCIVLPVLNEATNIVPLLERIHAVLGSSYIVCLIDDGSRDDTVMLAKGASARLGAAVHMIQRVKEHAGSQRGSALYAGTRWGFEQTRAAVFVEMDGDLSHRPEELSEGIELVASGSCQVAIASKYVPGAKVVDRPFRRRLISLVCNALVRRLIAPSIRDYSNGYRFYSRSAAELIVRTPIRYGSPIYLTEVLSIWLAHGLQVREFPTTYVGRGKGESKLRVVDLIKAVIAVFEIAYRLHLGGFRTRESVYDRHVVNVTDERV
jgi:dolichol-phosphate mannosyltransferase